MGNHESVSSEWVTLSVLYVLMIILVSVWWMDQKEAREVLGGFGNPGENAGGAAHTRKLLFHWSVWSYWEGEVHRSSDQSQAAHWQRLLECKIQGPQKELGRAWMTGCQGLHVVPAGANPYWTALHGRDQNVVLAFEWVKRHQAEEDQVQAETGCWVRHGEGAAV